MRPLPFLGPGKGGFFASRVTPMPDPTVTLGFFGGRLVFFDGFLFVDELAGLIPFGGKFPSCLFFTVAYYLIKPFSYLPLFLHQIGWRKKVRQITKKEEKEKRTTDLCLRA